MSCFLFLGTKVYNADGKLVPGTSHVLLVDATVQYLSEEHLPPSSTEPEGVVNSTEDQDLSLYLKTIAANSAMFHPRHRDDEDLLKSHRLPNVSKATELSFTLCKI